MNSYQLLAALKGLGHINNERDPWWWPDSGSLRVVVGALLTQQTRWEKVEQSLANLRQAQCLTLSALADADVAGLRRLIAPSGFYNTKAERLTKLAQNMRRDFGDFDTFRQQVSRAWLLNQAGIGPETADSILCYACYRPVMVADAYSQRLLHALGVHAPDYASVQNWLLDGLQSHSRKVADLYRPAIGTARVYARFHGKIVEYCKHHSRGKRLDIAPLTDAIPSKL
ncbi:MAG: 3-methyladenine DNA glycosylase [Gammaproteobacteria bacterium]|nr:MAG: 3-methyladenine DNA glycosylase [Gammaproteobacteria bacterium]